MGKPTICIGENKGADQLRSNSEADQRLCFRNTDSTIPLLSKSKISSLYPSSVIVQADLCRTWSETQIVSPHAKSHFLLSHNLELPVEEESCQKSGSEHSHTRPSGGMLQTQ